MDVVFIASEQKRARELDKVKEMGMLRIAVIGGATVGKSTFLHSLQGKSLEEYVPTLTEQPVELVVTIGPLVVTFVDWAWDQMYQQQNRDVASVIQKCDGAIFIFAYDSTESFRSGAFRLNEFDRANKKPVLVVGNKMDLKKKKVDDIDVERLVKKRNASFLKTSALRDPDSVRNALRRLGGLLSKDDSSFDQVIAWDDLPKDEAGLRDLIASSLELPDDTTDVAAQALEAFGLSPAAAAKEEPLLGTLRRCAVVVKRQETTAAKSLFEKVAPKPKQKERSSRELTVDEDAVRRAKEEDRKRGERLKAKVVERERREKDAETARHVALAAIHDNKVRAVEKTKTTKAFLLAQQARVDLLVPDLANRGYDALDAVAIASRASKAARHALRLAEKAKRTALQASFNAIIDKVSDVEWPDVIVHFYPPPQRKKKRHSHQKQRANPDSGLSLRLSMTWTWCDRPVSDFLDFVCRHLNDHHIAVLRRDLHPVNLHFETLLGATLDPTTPLTDAVHAAHGSLLLRHGAAPVTTPVVVEGGGPGE